MTVVRQVDGAAPDESVIAAAVAAFASGALLIYPTETLYALGGPATDAFARRVRAAKGRDDAKPLPLVAADPVQVRGLCGRWPEAAEALAQRFWPGPLTLVLPAASGLSDGITSGTGTIAVRVPGLELPRALCRRAGALISTSANRSGEAPPATCAPAVAAIGAHAALALDAGLLGGLPSSIVDLTGAPVLLRDGAVSADALERALREAGASLQTGQRRRDTTP